MDIANNKKSVQKVIKKADHYYQEKGTAKALIDTIDEWLTKLR